MWIKFVTYSSKFIHEIIISFSHNKKASSLIFLLYFIVISSPLGLRQQPAMDLRKTCKILKPFLPSEKQTKFQESYAVMIDAVNDMDVVRTYVHYESGFSAVWEHNFFVKSLFILSFFDLSYIVWLCPYFHVLAFCRFTSLFSWSFSSSWVSWYPFVFPLHVIHISQLHYFTLFTCHWFSLKLFFSTYNSWPWKGCKARGYRIKV